MQVTKDFFDESTILATPHRRGFYMLNNFALFDNLLGEGWNFKHKDFAMYQIS